MSAGIEVPPLNHLSIQITDAFNAKQMWQRCRERECVCVGAKAFSCFKCNYMHGTFHNLGQLMELFAENEFPVFERTHVCICEYTTNFNGIFTSQIHELYGNLFRPPSFAFSFDRFQLRCKVRDKRMAWQIQCKHRKVYDIGMSGIRNIWKVNTYGFMSVKEILQMHQKNNIHNTKFMNHFPFFLFLFSIFKISLNNKLAFS